MAARPKHFRWDLVVAAGDGCWFRGGADGGRCGAQQSAEGGALLGEPVVEDADVPAYAEVLDAHFDVRRGRARVTQLHSRWNATSVRCLDHVPLRFAHQLVRRLTRHADTHRVVGRTELHHIDATDV